MNTNKHQLDKAENPSTSEVEFIPCRVGWLIPNKCVRATAAWTARELGLGRDWPLVFLFVQLRFDRGLNFFVKCLVVLQNFFSGVAALGKLRAFVVQP